MSGEANFALRPWVVRDADTVCVPMEDGRCLRVAYIDSGRWFIPEGFYHQMGAAAYQARGDEIQTSHAHLIAAAPELYEALRKCPVALREAADLYQDNDLPVIARLYRDLAAACEAALAKAAPPNRPTP